jgi:peptidyl-prolyl cis-trans isomerase C
LWLDLILFQREAKSKNNREALMFNFKRMLALGFTSLSLVVVGGLKNGSLASDEGILAKVGNSSLSASDVRVVMETDPQIKELIKQKPELKGQIERLVVDRWLNITLLYLNAKEKGLDKDPLIQKKLSEMEKYLLAEEVLQKELSGIKSTEEELKKFYEKNKELYTETEGLKLKHILIYVPEKADKQTREKALAKAKKVREELRKGAKFEELAKKYSDDTASREKGGDIGVLRKGMTVPEFEKKVFSLKEGSISEPIESPYGYHIVKIEKSVPPKVKSFEEVKDQVQNDYIKEKEREIISKLIEELRNKYKPQVFLEGGRGAKSK